VYLTGAVPSTEQKGRAETVAKGVSGVRRVVNSLDVRPARE
jgi:osmotically-inducible protein OsmY